MKKILILVFVLIAFSCEERVIEEPTVPEWLKPRLEELENSGDCNGCTVQQSTYNDEYFYHLYCSYWSCSHCEVYHYDGTLVEWNDDFPLSDWLENRQRIIIIWECGDSLE